jgi:hypothetical protein
LERVSDEVNRRLVEAYEIQHAVEAMEDKLGDILLEVLNED